MVNLYALLYSYSRTTKCRRYKIPGGNTTKTIYLCVWGGRELAARRRGGRLAHCRRLWSGISGSAASCAAIHHLIWQSFFRALGLECIPPYVVALIQREGGFEKTLFLKMEWGRVVTSLGVQLPTTMSSIPWCIPELRHDLSGNVLVEYKSGWHDYTLIHQNILQTFLYQWD